MVYIMYSDFSNIPGPPRPEWLSSSIPWSSTCADWAIQIPEEEHLPILAILAPAMLPWLLILWVSAEHSLLATLAVAAVQICPCYVHVVPANKYSVNCSTDWHLESCRFDYNPPMTTHRSVCNLTVAMTQVKLCSAASEHIRHACNTNT